MKTLIAIVLTASLLGCSMSPEEVALETQKLNIMKTALTQPTLKCTSGCTYIDPKRNLNLFPEETNGWDFANKLLDTGIAVAPWMAVTNIAVKGLSSAGDRNSNNSTVHEENSSVVKNDTQTTTITKNAGNDLLESSSKDASISNRTTTNTTTSVVENNSVNGSNNPQDSNDNNSVTQLPVAPIAPVGGL